MAPQKRKAQDPFFFYTISDDEAVEEEVVEELQPPTKRKKKQRSVDEDDETHWGEAGRDDGAMDPEFEFFDGDAGLVDGDEDNTGLEWAGQNKTIDLEDIIRKKREKKEGKKAEKANGAEEAAEGSDVGEPTEGLDLKLDDEADEVLAEDGFGMGVASDAEDSDKEGGVEDDMDDEEDAAASDDDSVATPVDHPEDDEESEASGDEEEVGDEEELEKQRAFFAPEEKAKAAKADPSTFQGMRLFSRPILRGITAAGFEKPTQIQAKTIPFAVEGKDVVGQAVTGSGKTAAFLLPILERLLYRPTGVPATRVVILTPTRELAVQCHKVATKLASHTSITIALTVGGTSFKSSEANLRSRPDIVIGTPGRFIDHMRNSPNFAVDRVEILVLDEADRMLQDGFADELNEIVKTLPKSRQTMLFSATMNSSVDQLIRVGLNKPVRILAEPKKKTAGNLVQEFVRLRPGREEKRMGYLVHLCKTLYRDHAIIFFREKRSIHRARIIFGLLGLTCQELHGNIKQAERTESLESFRRGSVSFLLASDLASRGLDIKGVETVINYEVPKNLEDYIHRIGRTARAGQHGVAVTIVTEKDRKFVRAAAKSMQNTKLKSRTVESAAADEWQGKIDELEEDIEEILEEEEEAKQLAQAEMHLTKGENLLKHHDEIMSRPKRTWFKEDKDDGKGSGKPRFEKDRDGSRSGKASDSNKKPGSVEKLREAMKKRQGGNLSNKDKKRLDAKQDRLSGKGGMKLKQFKKVKPGGKAGGGGVKAGRVGKWRPGKKTDGKVAPSPFRRAGQQLPSPSTPRFRQSLLRYFFPFPPAVRQRYRERLLAFRLDTLPRYKHGLQSRVHRFLVNGERRRRDKARLVDRISRYGGRLLLGPETKKEEEEEKENASTSAADKNKMMQSSQWGYSYGYSQTDSVAGEVAPRERGARRRKLAAMAGTVYRAGIAAASEIREQYSNTRVRGVDTSAEGQITIPGSFPDVAIVGQDDEQMVLFPSYAKRHARNTKRVGNGSGNNTGSSSGSGGNDPPLTAAQTSMNNEQYWHQQWVRVEDEKAVVDVDVRGWIYMPQKGPMTRKNRLLVGLARRLSGIPAPTVQSSAEQQQQPPYFRTPHEEHEELREQQRIAKEAEEIEKRGRDEKEVANRGGYSEPPKEDDSDVEGNSNGGNGGGGAFHRRSRSGTATPSSAPSSPALAARSSWNTAADLTEAELAVANANLMARLGPFLTTPLSQLTVTIFFYNDTRSVSRTTTTNDAGHFSIRAPLDFVPTHVKVLANESLMAVEPIRVIEDRGVSVISDIDDTIKRSNISLGAREIFRNTFIRDLRDLTVDGVREWYSSLRDMGVQFHYCSNSPWQLFPVLATFFKLADLPPGSLHLKQYSGMLQGIFEPVAERKKSTLERILRDFPQRRFLLVGDSGEADLEVYTDLVQAHPGRILAVFIRDVTTPERPGYFDAAIDPSILRRKAPAVAGLASISSRNDYGEGEDDDEQFRPRLPPRVQTDPLGIRQDAGPAMGTLIDLSEEPEEMSPVDYQKVAAAKQQPKLAPGSGSSSTRPSPSGSSSPGSALDLLGRKPVPPRPAKPMALRSAGPPSEATSVGTSTTSGDRDKDATTRAPPPPPLRRKPTTGPQNPKASGLHPLTQIVNSSEQSLESSGPATPIPAPPPPPRRQPSWGSKLSKSASSASLAGQQQQQQPPPPPPRRRNTPTSSLNLSPRLLVSRRGTSRSELDALNLDAGPEPFSLGAPAYGGGGSSSAAAAPGHASPSGSVTPTGATTPGTSKKVELWRRRLLRAQETLERHGVALYTWRRGDDVVLEAVGIVREAMREMKAREREGQGQGQGQGQGAGRGKVR